MNDMATSDKSSLEIKAPVDARELSLLDLNNIRLDIKHTVLTPEYLENLQKANKQQISGLS